MRFIEVGCICFVRGVKFFLLLMEVFVLKIGVGVDWIWGKIEIGVLFCCLIGLFGFCFLFKEGFRIGGWEWIEYFRVVEVIVLFLFVGWGLFVVGGVKLECFLLFWDIKVIWKSYNYL